MFKRTQTYSLQVSLKSLIACGLIAVSTTQIYAEQAVPNGQGIPEPVWNGPIPITWGDCIPVPIAPMAMPPARNNRGMGMPYAGPLPMPSGAFPSLAPAPINRQIPPPAFLLPPPGPFFDVAPAAPLPLMPMPPIVPTTACNDTEDKLITLQEHYNLAAAASRKKIEELTQTLKDSQNQLQDSIASVEMMAKSKSSNQANTNELADSLSKLKQTSEAMISMQEQENADLKKQLAALNKRLNTATESSKSQAQKLLALGHTTKDLDALKKQLTNLTALNNAFQEEIANLKSKTAGSESLKKQLADAIASKQSLEIKLNELLKSSADTINKSSSAAEKSLTKAKEASTKAHVLSSQLEASTNQLNTLKQQFETLKIQLGSANAANKKLQAQLAALKTNDENKNKTIFGLKQSSSQLAEIQKAYQAQQSKTKGLEQQLIALQKLKTELTYDKTRSADLLKQNEALKKQLADLSATYKNTEAQFAALKADGANKNKTIYGLKQSASQLIAIQQAYQASQNKIKNLEKQLAELSAANKKTEEQLTALKAGDTNKNKTIQGLKQSASQLIALQQAYQASQNKNKNLEQQLAGLEKLKTELANCKTNGEVLSKEIAASRQNTENLKAELANYKTHNEKLSNDIAASRNENASLQAELAKLKNTSDSQAQKLSALMSTSTELEQLKAKYQSLSSSKQELLAQLASATADKDKDGIIDKSDKCPFTPEGTVVNALGCIADADNDGVPDSNDKCPASPVGSHVNEQGCPKIQDSDNDGVANANDLCPSSTPGTSVNEFGCSAAENITLKGVNFKLGSAKLTDASLPILDAAAETLKKHPNLKIEVAGHTDNQGFAGVNRRLSQRRANTVMIYLIRKGVKAESLTAKGYGEKQPITTNDSKENRALNRRVELKILK